MFLIQREQSPKMGLYVSLHHLEILHRVHTESAGISMTFVHAQCCEYRYYNGNLSPHSPLSYHRACRRTNPAQLCYFAREFQDCKSLVLQLHMLTGFLKYVFIFLHSTHKRLYFYSIYTFNRLQKISISSIFISTSTSKICLQT